MSQEIKEQEEEEAFQNNKSKVETYEVERRGKISRALDSAVKSTSILSSHFVISSSPNLQIWSIKLYADLQFYSCTEIENNWCC